MHTETARLGRGPQSGDGSVSPPPFHIAHSIAMLHEGLVGCSSPSDVGGYWHRISSAFMVPPLPCPHPTHSPFMAAPPTHPTPSSNIAEQPLGAPNGALRTICGVASPQIWPKLHHDMLEQFWRVTTIVHLWPATCGQRDNGPFSPTKISFTQWLVAGDKQYGQSPENSVLNDTRSLHSKRFQPPSPLPPQQKQVMRDMGQHFMRRASGATTRATGGRHTFNWCVLFFMPFLCVCGCVCAWEGNPPFPV